ncbi:MAG: phosphotransferase [Gaiellales bacterium]
MTEELPLTGGDIHVGDDTVVRVGDTVRRPAGPQTPAVHALLDHFAKDGLEGVPRVLGFDERGREILTHVPGEAALAPVPASDDLVFELGAFLREMHDCQREFSPDPAAPWQRLVGAPATGEVVCHNDLFWPNVIVEGNRLRGVIDWDLAAPGPRLHDLASAANLWLPLRPDEHAEAWGLPTDRRDVRARALCDGYGLPRAERPAILDAVLERATIARATFHLWGRDERRPGWAHMWDRDQDRYLVGRDAWVAEHAATIRSWLL